MSGSNLLSIGAIASRTQRSVAFCRERLAELGQRPQLKLNGVDYFDQACASLIPTAPAGDASHRFIDMANDRRGSSVETTRRETF